MLASANGASASTHHLMTSRTPAAAEQGVAVTIVQDGTATSFVTRAKTVADFLAERDIVPGKADEVSPPRRPPSRRGCASTTAPRCRCR